MSPQKLLEAQAYFEVKI